MRFTILITSDVRGFRDRSSDFSKVLKVVRVCGRDRISSQTARAQDYLFLSTLLYGLSECVFRKKNSSVFYFFFFFPFYVL